MIKIAVSACLLGKNVRYDGGNKFINLSEHFNPDTYQLTGICPEVDMGMAIPREPIQIISHNKQIRLTQVKNPELDYTSQMELWFKENQNRFKQYSGYILKSKSPSCGHQTTPNYRTNGDFFLADGLFVSLLKENITNIAIINDTDLNDPIRLLKFSHALELYANTS